MLLYDICARWSVTGSRGVDTSDYCVSLAVVYQASGAIVMRAVCLGVPVVVGVCLSLCIVVVFVGVPSVPA